MRRQPRPLDCIRKAICPDVRSGFPCWPALLGIVGIPHTGPAGRAPWPHFPDARHFRSFVLTWLYIHPHTDTQGEQCLITLTTTPRRPWAPHAARLATALTTTMGTRRSCMITAMAKVFQLTSSTDQAEATPSLLPHSLPSSSMNLAPRSRLRRTFTPGARVALSR